jgi:hypothetical protein
MQARTYESHSQLSYDVAGNLNKPILIQDIESPTLYKNTFSVMYEEIRVDRVEVTFYPGSDHIYGLHDFDCIRMIPYHRELPTSMTNDKASSIAVTRTFAPTAKRCTAEWRRIPSSPIENTFYPAQGDILNHYLPLGLGGVYLYCDGPAAFAGSFGGALYVRWHVTFRGVRSDDNQSPPTLAVPIRPSSASLSDVVVLSGKQYVRVGEATNPGPDEDDDSDDDSDSDHLALFPQ